MLSREDNELLCRVGRGTPMGELMRQYWMPAALSSELPERNGAPLRVRLLGEDLIAFRTASGAVGLVRNSCPHRGASLFYNPAPGAASDRVVNVSREWPTVFITWNAQEWDTWS